MEWSNKEPRIFFRALFLSGTDMVCMIDDREDVWECEWNLNSVSPYIFFKNTDDMNTLDVIPASCEVQELMTVSNITY